MRAPCPAGEYAPPAPRRESQYWTGGDPVQRHQCCLRGRSRAVARSWVGWARGASWVRPGRGRGPLDRGHDGLRISSAHEQRERVAGRRDPGAQLAIELTGAVVGLAKVAAREPGIDLGGNIEIMGRRDREVARAEI